MSDIDVYTLIEARVQSLIQAEGTFKSASVRLGDPRALDSGAPPYCFLLRGRADTGQSFSPRSRDCKYPVTVWLVEQAHHDGTEWTNIKSRSHALENLFQKYPCLNGLSSEEDGYQTYSAKLTSDSEPFYEEPKVQGALSERLLHRMTLLVKMIVVVDGGEYG